MGGLRRHALTAVHASRGAYPLPLTPPTRAISSPWGFRAVRRHQSDDVAALSFILRCADRCITTAVRRRCHHHVVAAVGEMSVTPFRHDAVSFPPCQRGWRRSIQALAGAL
jgi:hypothetical protein